MEIVWFVITGILLWWIVIYNLLVRDRNRILAAWSDIDVQLKRRHDLIPKLVDAVRQYTAYEQATLAAITTLRSKSEQAQDVEEIGPLEAALGEKIHTLLMLAEDYPELKASQSFLDLQRNLTEVENNIQYARRFYNGAVRNLNTRIDTFPDTLVARWFRYQYAPYFELKDKSQRKPPELN